MDVSWLTTEPVAHRGFHWVDDIDENSWEAFMLSVEKNRPFECDVHLSADGEVYVHHDESLLRMTGVDIKFSELRSHEIDTFRTPHSQEPIVPLKKLLKTLKGQVPIVIEIKRSLSSNALEKRVLEVMKNYKGDFSLQSFHPQSLYYCRQNSPQTILGVLGGEECFDFLSLPMRAMLKSLSLGHIIQPQYLAYEWSSLDHWSARKFIERYNIPLLAWTVNSSEIYNKVNDKVDNIIYENLTF